jgi:hypothetical protein
MVKTAEPRIKKKFDRISKVKFREEGRRNYPPVSWKLPPP